MRLSALISRVHAACCLLAIADNAHAAAPDGRLFEPDRAWLERCDPTLISSRCFGEFAYESYDDVSALEVKFPVAFKINGDWSGFLSYNPRWNLLDESARHRLELGTTVVWGVDNQYASSIGGELPLASESFEFKLATGFAWYF